MSETPRDDDTMSVTDYLARGGVLSNPSNVPPRYRAELLRLMAVFVDSELAGAAGFADVINAAPGIAERIAAARIVAEKTRSAGRVLKVMGEFGADVARYATHQPWNARGPRDAEPSAERQGGDMRLPVFYYPLEGWIDSVVMNLVMGSAVTVQMGELSSVSYQPLAEAFRKIAPVEAEHVALAEEGLSRLDEGARAEAQASVAYWWPRVALSFGEGREARFEALKAMGLRHRPTAELRADWEKDCSGRLAALGLTAP